MYLLTLAVIELSALKTVSLNVFNGEKNSMKATQKYFIADSTFCGCEIENKKRVPVQITQAL